MVATMLKDRGDLLKYALSDAIASAAWEMRVIANTGTIRERVAEDAVEHLRRLPDDPWKLAEPLPQNFSVASSGLGNSMPSGWCKPKP
jgi:hypothetical protein